MEATLIGVTVANEGDGGELIAPIARRICSVDGCDNDVLARGWCRKHYQRWWTYGSPTGKPPEKERASCDAPGCSREDVHGHGLCRLHYQRWRKSGSLEALEVGA